MADGYTYRTGRWQQPTLGIQRLSKIFPGLKGGMEDIQKKGSMLIEEVGRLTTKQTTAYSRTGSIS